MATAHCEAGRHDATGQLRIVRIIARMNVRGMQSGLRHCQALLLPNGLEIGSGG
jgi:hypothetical protein